MKILLVGLLVCGSGFAAEETILFQDAFKGEINEGWSWLRADPADWRATEDGLEIRIRPGNAKSVKNALVRPVPEFEGRLVVEVTVTFLSAPTQQYEQAGITWYRGAEPVFKLVHELIDGDLFIVPGKPSAEVIPVRLRLIADGHSFVAQFRQHGEEKFKTAAEGELELTKDDKISIQAYQGPADTAHWVKFSDFTIKCLPK